MNVPVFRIRTFLGLPDPHPDPLVRGTDRWIRIRIKTSRIRNTDENLTYQNRDVVEIDSGEGAVSGLYSLQDVPGLGGIRRLSGECLQTYAV